ncbi:hypothetical protein ACMFMF_007693 [Clarireedia jacksonii]
MFRFHSNILRFKSTLQSAPSRPSGLDSRRSPNIKLYSNMVSMQAANRLRRVMEEGKEPAIGCWQMIPGANVSRTLARTGVDWVLVDCEHGNIDACMNLAITVLIWLSYDTSISEKRNVNVLKGKVR